MSEARVAFLFPGQGSQRVGMGADLVAAFPEAAAVYEEAARVLDVPLGRLSFEGPMEELTQTRNAQPAILLHSLAVARVLRERTGLEPSVVAGHSLGEFSAAASVGVFSLSDALRVVRKRGELMWDAGERQAGAMSAVVGMGEADLTRICEEISAAGDGTVVVANLNSETQIVISGDAAAVTRAEAPLKQAGARRVLPLPVSGAFHSPLMVPLQSEFEQFLSDVEMKPPTASVVSNVTAMAVDQVAGLRAGFVQQLVSPVRWHDSVARMVADGVETFIEVGPGNVLTNMGSRSFRDANFVATSDVPGLEKVLASLASKAAE